MSSALEARLGRIEQQLGSLLSHNRLPRALNDPSVLLIPELSVTAAYIADATITNAKIVDATIQSAKIASLAADKITAGSLSVAVNVTVGGKLTIGDANPAANGGVLIDNSKVVAYASGGANFAQMNSSGFEIRSERGAAFFAVKNQAGNRSIELTMDPSGGRSFWLSSNVNGAKGEMVWIDQTVTGGVGASISDLFSFGATVRGMAIMVHVIRTDTGASLGHIMGSVGVGGTLYVSTVATEASSGGTTTPSMGLNASNGIDFSAHASLQTRFMGFVMVVYQ